LIQITVASIQITFRQLEALLKHIELPSSPDKTRFGICSLAHEELQEVKKMVIRGALGRARDTLGDLRKAVNDSKTYSLSDETLLLRGDKRDDDSLSSFLYESDSSYLQLVICRLEAVLELLNRALNLEPTLVEIK
jgi:hypothetical protein